MLTAPNDLRRLSRRAPGQSASRVRAGLRSLAAALPALVVASSASWAADAFHPFCLVAGSFACGNSIAASQQTLLDLGSNFLQRAGDQATWGTNAAAGHNPGGGGASQSATPQPFRSWAELYGIGSRADPQGSFVGDHRSTIGGVAGFGATVLPGLNLGVTLDQSASQIDMPLALQTAQVGLTQLGFNASYTVDAWTLVGIAVHGLGNISSQRGTLSGPAVSNYGGQLDGALSELSYYWGIGQTRVVPKAGIEYVRAQTAAFREQGGFEPVLAGAVTSERARVLLGAELGHYWLIDGRFLDLSGYGKFVDNFMQNIGSVAVTLGAHTIAVQGILESQYGADAGAGLSYALTDALRAYANYDGRFRQNFISHQGTLGLELRW